MGEYAHRTSDGAAIKMGTCEDLYYLRHDRRHDVTPDRPGNADIHDLAIAAECRFRFPWPDEDTFWAGEIGENDYERRLWVPGLTVPAGVDHHSIQFSHRAGYLLSMPCPEGPDAPAGVHRNGFVGAVHLCQQKPTADGETLRLILACGGCGAKWRAETWIEAEPVVVALRAEADRLLRQARISPHGPQSEDTAVAFYHTVADRVAEGYPEGRAE